MTRFEGFQHRSGNAKKDGKPYDFYEVHFTTDLNTWVKGRESIKDTIQASDLGMDEAELERKIGFECQLLYRKNGKYTNLVSIAFTK